MNFCIYPAGAWGTAMAIHLSRLKHNVTLVPLTQAEAIEMVSSRENKAYFPGHPLDTNIQIGLELKPAMMEADVFILSCPSKFLRSVCQNIRQILEDGSARELKIFISLCKGLNPENNQVPSAVILEELKAYPMGVLSGPTYASQVALGKPSAIVFATNADAELARNVQTAISGSSLRVYTLDDFCGVELGGCLKNVYAIASGVCDGLELGDNTKAALLTRSLAEMVRVGVALGGKVETFYGLSGFGDLVLTSNGQESRNRTFGELFARGESIQHLIEEKKMTVEGYRTCESFYHIVKEKQIDAPILNEIYAILYQGKGPLDVIKDLMTRELKSESSADH